ncbi:hypothetical protein Leryth_016534 [Lithospermum erythrorhizon]|nr:hypothetical protein Leryth_016534 [Lithospermum erythrorhizon]
MTFSRSLKSLSPLISWKSTGKLQQTVAKCIERTGSGLHSGKQSTVRIWPELAGKGRYFHFRSIPIPASILCHSPEGRLCTTLCKDGHSVRTVEHLLSALEGMGVDNCKIEIESSDPTDFSVEVPIFDGSAREWVEAIRQGGLKKAIDSNNQTIEKVAPFVDAPVHVCKNDSFIAAFPWPEVNVTYGIDFKQAYAIGRQWFSSTLFSDSFYAEEIAPSRTFCIYEEVEQMRKAKLINGGSLENAIVCSVSRGWLNPPLRFKEEPCRHKVLDLIGDLSLFAQAGSQGFPVAHLIAYKAGHALHAEFVRALCGSNPDL